VLLGVGEKRGVGFGAVRGAAVEIWEVGRAWCLTGKKVLS